MKKRRFGLTIVLFVIVAATIVLTTLIVTGMIAKQPVEKESAYLVRNAYVTSGGEDRIRFAYEGISYEFEGRLSEPYQGIADITIEGNRIKKLSVKSDYITGKLDAYSKETISVSGIGDLDRGEEIRVYSVVDGETKCLKMSDLVVGASELKYVFDEGRVCAIIVEQKPQIQTIRVLLKNKSALSRKKLYLSADAAWQIGDSRKKANAVCDVNEEFLAGNVKILQADCKRGKLYLCSKKGKRLGNAYEGSFTLRKGKEGIIIVNELPIEDYVRYVLPSEMPPSFAPEALMAQAVCARTFAYKQMTGENYAGYGANLDDSTSYQVYNASLPTKETDEAVAKTAGIVMKYEGELIDCYYYSTSPGVTEDLEVWGEEESPAYLKAVRTVAKEEDCGDLSQEKNFHSFIAKRPKAADSGSPYYRWDAALNAPALADSSLGEIRSIRIKKRSQSGYALKIVCIYENGKKTFDNEFEIRSFLGKAIRELKLQDGSVRQPKFLPSSCFEVAERKGDTIRLRGGGFGHGVGLSQYGANEFGKQGKTHEQILAAYYPGAELLTIDTSQ